jgi:hypothetical protein
MSKIQRDWEPSKTWLFAVGIIEYEDSETSSGFPDAAAGRFDQKLVDFFHSAEIPDEHIVYLQDQEATLDAIEENLAALLENTEEYDLFILYFAGHGDWDSDTDTYYFINYDAEDKERDNSWSISSIFELIENSFNGSKVLLLADCCFSGGLITQLNQLDSEISYACVSSAYAHNTSTGAWTFTEALYQGLLGDPIVDLDGDRVITLYDFARYAELEMAFIESQKSMFVTTNDFDPQMILASVNDEIEPIEGKRVEVEFEGEWYKAKTLKKQGSQVRIQYVVDQSEEWVEPERIRPYAPQMFAVGEEVEAQSDEEWYPATVQKAWYGLHRVSYDDYPPTWDEWVGLDYIRPRQS